MIATSAASRSLSPNVISSVATVSFSFTTGIAPADRSRSNVRWALTNRRLATKSSWVKRICAATRSRSANRRAYSAIREPCPTAAAAWRPGRSFGRREKPSGARPEAMAPEETSTQARPPRAADATSRTILRMRARATTPVPSTKLDDPTLTTSRRTSGICLALVSASPIGSLAQKKVPMLSGHVPRGNPQMGIGSGLGQRVIDPAAPRRRARPGLPPTRSAG